MHSAQNTMMAYIAAMKRKYTMNSVLHGENNELSTNNQRTSFIRTWNNFFSGIYLPNMWPANNPLSVTIVNNEILNSGLSEHLSTKNKDLSYILQEEKLLCDLKQKNSKDYTYNECMFSVSILEHASKNHLQDWPCNNVDNPNLIKNRNYVNLIKNFGDTYKDNSTTESHSMLHVNEKEKTTEDIMTDVSGPSDIDSQKREIGIHEDTDVESFLVVAHSDVPATPPSFVKENPISRLSNVCRNVWDSFTKRLYCKTMSADSGMSVKRLSYSTKQHHRRKANAIAIGRGRGRAKGQLRRSGVSQTVCRKECIKCDDYEIWPNDFIDTTPNDCTLDNKRDNLNKGIPDTTQFMKQINSPHTVISNFPKTTPAKRKSKARKKKKIKARYMTKVRYIADPSKMNDYYEDSNSEMHDVREDSSRSRLLSESSIDSEDSFVVFENDELPETCEKQGAIEHPTETRNVPDSSMSANDNPYDDSDSETYDFQKDSFQLRLLSESSDDCTDNFIIFDEQEVTHYPEMRYDCLTKINDKCREDCNSQTQKNLFQRYRLPSDSSQNTDDSFSIVFTDIEENCAIDDVDGDEIEESSYDVDSQPEDESISEDDQESEKLIAQTKKVSFDLAPVVHIMVKWNYAYRAARKGPWEEIARDNERFRGRINSIAMVLDPILKSNHRLQIWQERFAFRNSFSP